MSTAQILDEIDVLLEEPVIPMYDAATDTSLRDYAERHHVTQKTAQNKLDAGVEKGVLTKHMARNPVTRNQMTVYRKAGG